MDPTPINLHFRKHRQIFINNLSPCLGNDNCRPQISDNLSVAVFTNAVFNLYAYASIKNTPS